MDITEDDAAAESLRIYAQLDDARRQELYEYAQQLLAEQQSTDFR